MTLISLIEFEDTSGVIGRHKFNIFLVIYSNPPDFCNYFILFRNRISGVMVSVLASSAVDRGFEPKTVKLVFVASLLSTQYEGVRAKRAWLGIRILCPSGATCLYPDCCFSELALYKSNSSYCSRTKWTPSSSQWKINLFSP